MFRKIGTSILLMALATLPAARSAAQTLINDAALRGVNRVPTTAQVDLATVQTLLVGPGRSTLSIPPDTLGSAQASALWQAVVEVVDRDEPGFRRALELGRTNGALLASLATAELGSTRVIANAGVYTGAVLARFASDSAAFNKYLGSVGSNDAATRIAAFGAYLAGRLRKTERVKVFTPSLKVFAQGDVKGAATGSDSTKAFNGTGSLGIAYIGERYSIAAAVNVAATTDSVVSNYPGFVLTPNSGKLLSSAVLQYRGPLRVPLLAKTPRVLAYTGATASRWADSASNTRGNVLIIPAGVLLEVINKSDEKPGENDSNTRAEIGVDAGVSTRILQGNLASDKSAMRTLIGDTRGAYWGPEVGVRLVFNSVIAQATYYYYFGKRTSNIPHLTRGQLVAGISITGDIITIP